MQTRTQALEARVAALIRPPCRTRRADPVVIVNAPSLARAPRQRDTALRAAQAALTAAGLTVRSGQGGLGNPRACLIIDPYDQR